ncbi:PIG-P domain-containing protein [Entamoeba marina]
MQEIHNYEELIHSKTPTELNDGLDPDDEQKCYQGKSLSKDGIYIGTYSFFGFLLVIVLSIAFTIWQIVPKSFAPYLGLESFFNFMPDQYWAIALPSIILMIAPLILVGYYGFVSTFVAEPTSYQIYTDERSSEVTKKDKDFTMTNETIPPIEDCDVNLVSEFMYA